MLARKAAKPAGTSRTKTAIPKTKRGKKAANHRTKAQAVSATKQKHDEEELGALLTVILDDIDARLAAVNEVLDRIAPA
jgi:hypothetical protein